MPPQREIRDPIHGFIQRTGLVEKLIDTAPFQRLRRIKQLAMAYLVYPGAMHTRFGHSLGVMHIAQQLGRRLIGDQEVEELITLAALLHDIGHGPFSHVSEAVLERHAAPSATRRHPSAGIHEEITCSVIETHPEIAELLSPFQREKLVALILGMGGQRIEHSIVSGPMDADKQDYLLRDSYYCGVKYGIFDLDRLISSLDVHQDREDSVLVVSSGGVYAIEQFVLAKYHMSTQVYGHKTRLITDSMIVRAIRLGIEVDHIDWLERIYRYDGTEKHVSEYLQWDDQKLEQAILDQSDQSGLAREVFQRLRDRKLYKWILHRHARQFEDPMVRDLLSTLGRRPDVAGRLEAIVADALAEKCGVKVDPRTVIINVYTTGSVRKQGAEQEGAILVRSPSGAVTRFDEESTLFRSINAEEEDPYVEVYAPVTFRDETDKRRKRAQFDEVVSEAISRGRSLRLIGL